jgi:hypothetical protein
MRGGGRRDSGVALWPLARWCLWPRDASPPPPRRASIAAIGRNPRAAPAATIRCRASSAGSLRDPVQRRQGRLCRASRVGKLGQQPIVRSGGLAAVRCAVPPMSPPEATPCSAVRADPHWCEQSRPAQPTQVRRGTTWTLACRAPGITGQPRMTAARRIGERRQWRIGGTAVVANRWNEKEAQGAAAWSWNGG